MQQIALPSLFPSDVRPNVTAPFPLVRRVPPPPVERGSLRSFFAALLFGVLMSGTLVLLGYEARIYWDAHPNLESTTLEPIRDALR